MTGKIIDEKEARIQWQERAKKMTAAELPEFIRELIEDYAHDYGTICVAMGAAAVAAVYAVEHSPTGGITGFQAGAVMWEFISGWMHEKGPQRLVNFNDLLYPQSEDKFRTITPDTWEWVSGEAARHLAENGHQAHPDVKAHWESIVAGKIPFGLEVAT